MLVNELAARMTDVGRPCDEACGADCRGYAGDPAGNSGKHAGGSHQQDDSGSQEKRLSCFFVCFERLIPDDSLNLVFVRLPCLG
jgi:hypothetical protein